MGYSRILVEWDVNCHFVAGIRFILSPIIIVKAIYSSSNTLVLIVLPIWFIGDMRTGYFAGWKDMKGRDPFHDHFSRKEKKNKKIRKRRKITKRSRHQNRQWSSSFRPFACRYLWTPHCVYFTAKKFSCSKVLVSAMCLCRMRVSEVPVCLMLPEAVPSYSTILDMSSLKWYAQSCPASTRVDLVTKHKLQSLRAEPVAIFEKSQPAPNSCVAGLTWLSLEALSSWL